MRRRLFARLRGSATFGGFTKLIILGALVGFLGGVAGWLFHLATAGISEWAFRRPTGLAGEGAAGVGSRWWLVLLIPSLGGLLVGVLVARYAPEAEGHGTDAVIRACH